MHNCHILFKAIMRTIHLKYYIFIIYECGVILIFIALQFDDINFYRTFFVCSKQYEILKYRNAYENA